MVIGENLKTKFALISVFDKRKLNYLCANLSLHEYSFIASGSTGKQIRDLGFNCIDISKITKSKEMFDGRVKTLNHLIYSSLLYKRNDKKHKRQFNKLNIPNIDIVVVNFYPFEKYLNKNKNKELLEMIDIGGPTLIRAASKNYEYITPIVQIEDYQKLVKNLNNNHGKTDISFRKKMAYKVFSQTSNYDKIIAKWLYDKK